MMMGNEHIEESQFRKAIVAYDDIVQTIKNEINRMIQMLYEQGLDSAIIYSVQMPGQREIVGKRVSESDTYDGREHFLWEKGGHRNRHTDLTDKYLQYEKVLKENWKECEQYLMSLRTMYRAYYRLRLCYLIIDDKQYLYQQYQHKNFLRDAQSRQVKNRIQRLFFSKIRIEDLEKLGSFPGKAKIYNNVLIKGNLMYPLV